MGRAHWFIAVLVGLGIFALSGSALADRPFSLGPDVIWAKGTRTQTGATGTNCAPIQNGSITDDYQFSAPGDGTITITHYATGNKSTGTVAPNGQFDAQPSGGETAYAGQISVSTASATATGTVKAGSCTNTYAYTFKLDLELKLTTVRFDFTDRIAQEKRDLQAQIRDALFSKEAIDRNLPSYADAVRRAGRKVDASRRDSDAVAEELQHARLDVIALDHEEQFLPPGLQEVRTHKDRLEKQIAALEDQLLAKRARNPLGDFGGLIDQIERGRKKLEALEAELAQGTGSRAGYGEAKARLQARIRDLGNKLHALTLEELHADEALQLADSTFSKAISRLHTVDAQLLDLGEKLKGVDFEITRVTAAAGGKVIYVADNSQIQHIADLKDALAHAREAEAQAHATREQIVGAYFRQEGRVVHALDALLATQWQTAWAGIGIETVDAAIDLGIGFAEGGPIGLLAAAAKKETELLGAYVFDKIANPSGVDPGSIEAVINAEYNAGLSNALSFRSVGRAVTEDAIASTFTQWARDDILNPQLAKLLEREFKRYYAQAAKRVITPTFAFPLNEWLTIRREAEQLAKLRTQVDSLSKGGFKIKGIDVAVTIIKELAKTSAKAYFVDGPELDAWRRYIDSDMVGRCLFPLVHGAEEEDWKAHDNTVSLEQQLAAEEAKFPPSASFPAQVSEQFPPGADVVVTVEVANPTNTSPALDVTIGGVHATPTGTPYKWSIPPYSLALDNDRTVVLK